MNSKKFEAISSIGWSVLVIFSVLFSVISDGEELNALRSYDATDSFMLLAELATESSKDYTQAKADHLELMRCYIKTMKQRYKPSDVAKELTFLTKEIEKKGSGADQNREDCEKIKVASERMAEFLNKHKLFLNAPVIYAGEEVISEETKAVISRVLEDASEKTQEYINDLNMANAEIAYRANRKAIVYLYLFRSELSEIITEEGVRDLRGDINRAIYWNRVLKKSISAEEERQQLTNLSENELRHLRVLHSIITDDMREAHIWLQIAIKKAFPDLFEED